MTWKGLVSDVDKDGWYVYIDSIFYKGKTKVTKSHPELITQDYLFGAALEQLE